MNQTKTLNCAVAKTGCSKPNKKIPGLVKNPGKYKISKETLASSINTLIAAFHKLEPTKSSALTRKQFSAHGKISWHFKKAGNNPDLKALLFLHFSVSV